MSMGESKELTAFNIDDFRTDRSLCIEASAGTGKTYTIRQIVAKMIKEGVPLKEILIVTYTEKAAGELQDRIRGKLDEELKKHSDKHQERILFEKACRDVDNAAIFTIHSFCQKTLKEFAYDAGCSFDSQMVDDAHVVDLVERFIRDEWADDVEFQSLIKEAEKPSAELDKIKKQLVNAVKLYKGRNGAGNEIVELEKLQVEWEGDGISEAEARESLGEKLDSELDFGFLMKFPRFKKNFEILELNPEKNYVAVCNNGKKKLSLTIGELIENIKSWKSTQKKGPFTPTKNGDRLQDATSDECGKALQYVYGRCSALRNNKGKGVADAMRESLKDLPRRKFFNKRLPDLYKAWRDYKAEHKLQSYDDMILSVHREVTSDKSALKELLRKQYRFAIIDEFQDTNRLQWDIFRTVFLTDDGENPVENHAVFVVGDPKQSIYSFQGADLDVYRTALDDIAKITHKGEEGSAARRLSCNYRSTNKLIECCNAFFADYFGDDGDNIEFVPSDCPKEGMEEWKRPPEAGGVVCEPILFGADGATPEDFANSVVRQIVQWCRFKEGEEETVLRIFDKESFEKERHNGGDVEKKLRNVTFGDFAILARTSTEMPPIEDALRRNGVPYVRYKEPKLFKSRECSEWIALFRAIDAPDFSAGNRRLLNELLVTDFFRIDGGVQKKLGLIESEAFDDPRNRVREAIAGWKLLSAKGRYAEMLERIYADTGIEERLANVEKLQCIARLRQVGNYAVDYLYGHRCSLEDLVRHLEGVARYEDAADDENGDLVEKGSDFNAVRIMTVHASKGLQFPVVVAFAGWKGYNNNADGPYLCHDESRALRMGLGGNAKAKRKEEELQEWRRLFYVCYTRAESLLLLPRYKFDADKDFLKKRIDAVAEGKKPFDEDLESFDVRQCVQAILGRMPKPANANQIARSAGKQLPKNESEQEMAMSNLQGLLPGKSVMQYSYSSLSKKVPASERGAVEEGAAERNAPVVSNDEKLAPEIDAERQDLNVDAEEQEVLEGDDGRFERGVDESDGEQERSQEGLDGAAQVCAMESREPKQISAAEKKYPRGANVGTAMHKVLEGIVFQKFGEVFVETDSAKTASEIWNAAADELKRARRELEHDIEAQFQAVSLLPTPERTEVSFGLVWNTLNAKLPEIAGSEPTGKTFTLTSIEPKDQKSEIRFDFGAEYSKPDENTGEKSIRKVVKGFIDLLFVRNGRFSILDWKTDVLDDYGPSELKKEVDAKYSVQRVLYSRCLVQWLAQIYDMLPKKAFEEHFGGVYYAFLHGTDGKSGNGIYAQTWNSYEDLEKAYIRVRRLMYASKAKAQREEE